MTLKKETEDIETSEKEIDSGECESRTIVTPGEVVAEGNDFLPGEGTRREGKEILAQKFGLLEKNNKLVKIIPLSGAYVSRPGNVIIGRVVDITFNGWLIDILSTHEAFLSIMECYGYVNKRDLTELYDFNDLIVAKIKSVKARSIDLSMKERGFKKLEGGMLVRINSTRVPRVIGKAGSMVGMIKDETGCNIIVGQNGLVWINGSKVENELLAKKAIEMIVEKPFQEGLTEKVKEFLSKNKIK
ncbi:MAG: exosome complex RNA-binding protein Rrp4 [Candidatus Pacearchaeota archaeon]|nr:exosome complex RNA-binding protein Rrp4 [Candidatus Pacearchaeota archaeon]